MKGATVSGAAFRHRWYYSIVFVGGHGFRLPQVSWHCSELTSKSLLFLPRSRSARLGITPPVSCRPGSQLPAGTVTWVLRPTLNSDLGSWSRAPNSHLELRPRPNLPTWTFDLGLTTHFVLSPSSQLPGVRSIWLSNARWLCDLAVQPTGPSL